MIGVGKDDAGIELAGKIALQDAFDGSLSADGHENRRLDDAVIGVKEAGPGARCRTLGLDFELHCFQCKEPE